MPAMTTDITATYRFIKRLGAFKEIERFRGQYYWRDYPQRDRYESDADHSWCLAMIVLLISPRLTHPLNLERSLKMALIHDLPELIAGDPSPVGELGTGEDSHAFNATKRAEKQHRERQAAEQLLADLPPSLQQELLALWEEFEATQTFEAKVVRALDKWEAKLQVLEYTDGRLFPAHLDFTLKYGEHYFDCDPALQELMDTLEADFRDRYRAFA
jgi:putative hydrolase of HD superfamily